MKLALVMLLGCLSVSMVNAEENQSEVLTKRKCQLIVKEVKKGLVELARELGADETTVVAKNKAALKELSKKCKEAAAAGKTVEEFQSVIDETIDFDLDK